MNTLKIEAALAKKYGYKPLDAELSVKYRSFFKDNIPDFLQDNTQTLYTSWGTPFCKGFTRIVIGDYGAFVEISEDEMIFPRWKLEIPEDQEYRFRDKYKNKVKYLWYTIPDYSDIKIYYQQRRVKYADYKPGMYYVSVHEVYPATSPNAQQFLNRIKKEQEVKKILEPFNPVSIYVLRRQNSTGPKNVIAVFSSYEAAKDNLLSEDCGFIEEFKLDEPYVWHDD